MGRTEGMVEMIQLEVFREKYYLLKQKSLDRFNNCTSSTTDRGTCRAVFSQATRRVLARHEVD